MIIITSFGALSQWPIGYISDRIDRRILLIGATLVASGLSILIVISSYVSLIIFFIFTAIFSSMCLPMYALTLAHINDFLEQDEIVSASSLFTRFVGVSSILGPILVSSIMVLVGSNGFFVYLFVVHGILGLFGIYRMAKRAKPTDLESQYTPLPRNITPAGMELTSVTDTTEDK